ncbi:uncharacterized protein [Anabrus simplex]|uniref:uncharacterized protein n=1 Tax=Anabrus simplex TaxID=316456 RepID=UPI0035A2714D
MQSNNLPCVVDCHNIIISNIKNGETLCYSVVLVKGSVTRNEAAACRWPITKIHMRQYVSNDTKPIESEWPVFNSEFKCLASLSVGNNHILLEYCGTKTEFMVIHQPMKTNYHVLPVYIICSGHDGRFQAPAAEDNTVQSACERIALGAKLIQCLIAEKLHEAGFKKKTFQLEHDINPSAPECVVFHSHLSVDDARKMQPTELWEYFGRELMLSTLGNTSRKFLAFLSCTRYHLKSLDNMPITHEDIVSNTEAHVALGGGGLAVFGSACLHTWPTSIEDVVPRFLNQSKIDTRYFMDDSCYRGTYGGCFATTLGAVCHELGHTFDLGHSTGGIMGRGFDSIDMAFTVQPWNDNDRIINGNRSVISPIFKEMPQHSTVCLTKIFTVSYSVPSPTGNMLDKSQKEPNITINSSRTNDIEKPVNAVVHEENRNTPSPNYLRNECSSQNRLLKTGEDCAYWSRSCAALLNYHRWFNDEYLSHRSLGTIMFDKSRNTVSSSAGVRVVEMRDMEGLILSSWVFPELQGKELFPLPSEAFTESPHVIVAEDSVGNVLRHVLS